MTQNQYAIESMASDLKRVCLGLQRNSITVACRFLEEAKKRNLEIKQPLPEYINNIMEQSMNIRINGCDRSETAEDCLMYSTLLQNFARKV